MGILLELNQANGVIDQKKAKEFFQDSKSLFYKKVDGIRKQIEKGRYNRYAILQDGKIRVNYFVYYDYTTYRALLEDPITAKSVPKFAPNLIAEITPVSHVHHMEVTS